MRAEAAFRPCRSPPTPMSETECASRLGLNSGALLDRKQKMRSVVLVQHRCQWVRSSRFLSMPVM
jgi:hypothetical protein